MATISERIVLEGASELQAQLKGIGAAGSAAFKEVEDAANRASSAFSRLTPSLLQVEAAFFRLGASGRSFVESIGGAVQAFGRFEGAVLRTARNTSIFAAAITGVTAGLGLLVKKAADAADNIGEQAAGLGLSTDRYQELSAAASDSGIKQEQFGRALGNLAKLIKKDATPALKEAAAQVRSQPFGPAANNVEAFGEAVGRAARRIQALRAATGQSETVLSRLGVASIDTAGNMRAVDEVFLDVADAIAKLPPGVQQTTAAMEVFGTLLGRRFIDLLSRGSAGIKELGRQFGALKFTPDEIKIGDDVARQFGILELVVTRATQKLALLFGPATNELIAGFTDLILDKFSLLRNGIQNAVKGGIEPAVQDLVRLLQGDVANIQAPWVVELGVKFFALKDIITQAVSIIGAAFQALRSAAAGIADVINNVFGTKLSGDALLLAAAIAKVTGLLSLFTTGMVAAGAAGLVLLRGIALAGSAVSALAVGLAAAIGVSPLGIIAALVLIVAAFASSSDEIKRIWLSTFETLGEIASAGVSKLVQEVVRLLDIRPGEVFSWIPRAFKSIAQAILADAAKLGEGIVENIAIGAVKIGKLFGFLPAGFNLAAQEVKSEAEKLPEIIRSFEPKAERNVWQWFSDQFKTSTEGIKEGAEKVAADVVRAQTSVADTLRNLGVTTDTLKPKFDSLGAAGGGALDKIAQAADRAAREISEINARALSQQANLTDNLADAEANLDKALGKRKQDYQEIEAAERRIEAIRRQMRENEANRVASIRKVAETEASSTSARADAEARITRERELQQRLIQHSIDAAKFRDRPLGGAGAGAPELFPTGPAAQPTLDLSQINNEFLRLTDATSQATAAELQAAAATAELARTSGSFGVAAQQASTDLQSLDVSGVAADLANLVPPSGGEQLEQLQSSAAVVDTAFDALKQAADSAARSLQAVEAPSGGGGLAGGGLFRGKPGRDTNLAWLTDKEFVMRVPAVRKYGLSFMRAINAGRLPKFNLGGLVDGMTRSLAPFAIPGFDTGGQVEFASASSGRRVSVDLDLRTDRGHFRGSVSSDRSTAEALLRFSADKQLVSGGRRPSSYGGR